MPYKLIIPEEPKLDSAFVEAIARELREERREGAEDAPYIIEEKILRSHRIHVTVIWDRWGQVSPEERSRIIMEAYETVRGEGTFLTLTSALGLTHAEAKKLGVENGLIYAA